MHPPIEAVGVNELPVGVDRRRRGRVPGGVRRLPRPDRRATQRIERKQAAVPGGQKEEIPFAAGGRDAAQVGGRPIGDIGQGDVEEDAEVADVGRGDLGLERVDAGVPPIEIELQPIGLRAEAGREEEQREPAPGGDTRSTEGPKEGHQHGILPPAILLLGEAIGQRTSKNDA